MLIIYLIVALAVGAGAGFLLRKQLVSKTIGMAEGRAQKILDEAKSRQKEILLEAKSKSLEIIEQAKNRESEFRAQIVRFEERIDRREKDLDQKRKINGSAEAGFGAQNRRGQTNSGRN